MRQPKAGWYPDPTNRERLRYWTGRHWTQTSIDKDSQRPNFDAKLINGIENYRASRGKGKPVEGPTPFADEQASSKGPKPHPQAHGHGGFAQDATTFIGTNPLTSLLIFAVFLMMFIPDLFFLALALLSLGGAYFYLRTEKGNSFEVKLKLGESKKAKAKAIEAKQPKVSQVLYREMDAELAAEVDKFSQIALAHSRLENASLTSNLNNIIDNFQELLKRLDKYSVAQQKQVATVQYIDIFKKLNSALGDDYYLDIANNPAFWEEPQERMNAVQVAVERIEDELVNNIRKVNASKDLEFKVALDGLMRTESFVQPSDLLTPSPVESFWQNERFVRLEKKDPEEA